jgi:murein DD-endopeptidase MepM/ murein hydrolase activator NlpD
MEYPLLASVFFISLFLVFLILAASIFKPIFWMKNRFRINTVYSIWFIAYLSFILFFTGPEKTDIYPPQADSPYRLPWKAGVQRFVAQGNRSFTSHRGTHRFAWDFVMPNGTEILAARAGRVAEVKHEWEGIGFNSNYLAIEHAGGMRSVYAHIRFRGAFVKAGDIVRQGQSIAFSGMVGQTVFPHVHFYVVNKEGTNSVPVSFREVENGVPLAGHFYTSENSGE